MYSRLASKCVRHACFRRDGAAGAFGVSPGVLLRIGRAVELPDLLNFSPAASSHAWRIFYLAAFQA